MRRAAILAAVLWSWAAAAQAQYLPGNFTYRFYDKTGTTDIDGTIQAANMNSSGTVVGPSGGWFVFRVYLVQTGGSPSIDTVGVSGVGVRINYANSSGTGTPAMKVPAATGNFSSGNILNNSEFDFVNRYGTGTTTDTTYSAALTEGLIFTNDPVPLPADFGDTGRFYIGTFKMQNQGSLLGFAVVVTAIDPFNPGIDSQTGPNPPGPTGTIGDPAGGPVSNIDPYLSQYATPPVVPSFLIAEPEPSTFTLCLFAAAGLAVRGRRRATLQIYPDTAGAPPSVKCD
jgi:hypothetical protein